jgi:integrase/recombinase XerD
MTPGPNLASLLQVFFTERLIHQRQASSHTIAAYRDTFRLLLGFAHEHLGKAPSALSLVDLDTSTIGAFLDFLEQRRGNGARTRNARLAAIHSFFAFVALHDPVHGAIAQRVLAMPAKRWGRAPVTHLTRPEVEALLASPDRRTWHGLRDHTVLLLAVQTGLRVSELTGLRCKDIDLGRGAYVRCQGKGRKERCTPLRRDTCRALRSWLDTRAGRDEDPLFCTRHGRPLSRDAVEDLLAKHVRVAREGCPSLAAKRISPHVLRHTTAMDLLQRGVDRTVIALWLGHESIETTQLYLDADLTMKQRALDKTAPHRVGGRRFQADDTLLAFLESL